MKKYYEVIIANGFEKNALKKFKQKKNLRIIDSSDIKVKTGCIISGVNSFLMQKNDDLIFNKKIFKIVSKTKPSRQLIGSTYIFLKCMSFSKIECNSNNSK